MSDAQFATLDQPGLHELIDRLQLHISSVHAGIAHTYFPAQRDAMSQTQVQYTAAGSTLQLQF